MYPISGWDPWKETKMDTGSSSSSEREGTPATAVARPPAHQARGLRQTSGVIDAGAKTTPRQGPSSTRAPGGAVMDEPLDAGQKSKAAHVTHSKPPFLTCNV